MVMLQMIDKAWKNHLYDLDQLRSAIGYRSWGQKDPLVEYKQEAFSMFEDLMRDVQHTFAERVFAVLEGRCVQHASDLLQDHCACSNDVGSLRVETVKLHPLLRRAVLENRPHDGVQFR